MKKIFILIFLFIHTFLYSQIISINSKTSKLDNFEMYYIKDTSSSLNYEDIKNIDFKEKITNRFSFGYINYPIWLKLELNNNSKESNNFILALEEPFFDNITLLYEKNDTLYLIQNSVKDEIMDRNQPHPNSHFKLHLEPNETLTVYLKVRSLFYLQKFLSIMKNIIIIIQNNLILSISFILVQLQQWLFIIYFCTFI